MKRSLATAYSAKMKPSQSKSCEDCMAVGGKCYAHGGEVEMGDTDGSSAEMQGMERPDHDSGSDLSLAEAVIQDRKGAKAAPAPTTKEEAAPEEDGRPERGLNLEPVHTMEDSEHDTSDASLVAEIVKERKKRRMGM